MCQRKITGGEILISLLKIEGLYRQVQHILFSLTVHLIVINGNLGTSEDDKNKTTARLTIKRELKQSFELKK